MELKAEIVSNSMKKISGNPTLNIGDTTVGYSRKNLDQLKSTIDELMNKARKEVSPNSSSAYTELVHTLDNYWDGEDYDKFVSTLKIAATELEKSITTYQKDLTDSVERYAAQIKSFQTKNASNMSSLKIK